MTWASSDNATLTHPMADGDMATQDPVCPAASAWRVRELRMDKSDLPESFGVFKPVGHTVIAFRTTHDLLNAAARLQGQGFADEAMTLYTPRQMAAQVTLAQQTASPLASLGQELNLILTHRALAEAGCCFMVVHAPGDEQAEQVAVVARTGQAVAAQRYGHFLIEELIDPLAGTPQIFESPDRGLDLPLPEVAPHADDNGNRIAAEPGTHRPAFQPRRSGAQPVR